ncbi:uncharacterized protein LOC117640114 [Thrips palmi]|uniref:Uncharacterized protein LOC117640114 n=1 Tax=Thrips palmi TaxID=161013 RepID=A0A6P8XYU2_THRPL|nr:uncharacterized protein LOC117640114 [Thrips palmi]
MDMDQSPLLTLPDEVVLAVLACLPPGDVLSCSVLCRRLRGLCRDPELWRRLAVQPSADRWWRAALRFAPCLRELDLTAPYPTTEALQAVSTAMSSSACVVAKLTLDVREDLSGALTAALVQKTAALGGLNTVHLLIWESYENNDIWDVSMLFTAVHEVPELRELIIENTIVASDDWLECSAFEGSASLRKLTYSSLEDSDSPFLLERLLKRHASSLEHVRLYIGFAPVPVSLLAAIPGLRSLTCALSQYDDLSELKTSRGLNTLVLLGRNGPLPFPAGALAFLRAAPQLRSVALPSSRPSPAAPLGALAESPSASVLETLDLRGYEADLSEVAAALSRFPALRTLALDVHKYQTDNFLPAVSPATAPRLTTLEMRVPLGACPHAWLHDFAQDALERNPRLHLRTWFGTCPDKAKQCGWCRLGCHSRLGSIERTAFAAHAKTTGCPGDCFRWC